MSLYEEARKATPPTAVSVSSGLPLREELKAAGFLEGEDAQNYIIHHGLTSDVHRARNYATGGTDLLHCDAPHGKPAECDECEWTGAYPSGGNHSGGCHDCPGCGESLYH